MKIRVDLKYNFFYFPYFCNFAYFCSLNAEPFVFFRVVRGKKILS